MPAKPQEKDNGRDMGKMQQAQTEHLPDMMGKKQGCFLFFFFASTLPCGVWTAFMNYLTLFLTTRAWWKFQGPFSWQARISIFEYAADFSKTSRSFSRMHWSRVELLCFLFRIPSSPKGNNSMRLAFYSARSGIWYSLLKKFTSLDYKYRPVLVNNDETARALIHKLTRQSNVHLRDRCKICTSLCARFQKAEQLS